tara:strand:- start:1583 stop:1855 length:273 start_codon:yes stop_codon:yes gene_type:complete
LEILLTRTAVLQAQREVKEGKEQSLNPAVAASHFVLGKVRLSFGSSPGNLFWQVFEASLPSAATILQPRQPCCGFYNPIGSQLDFTILAL